VKHGEKAHLVDWGGYLNDTYSPGHIGELKAEVRVDRRVFHTSEFFYFAISSSAFIISHLYKIIGLNMVRTEN
jgi:hypothetical protein